MRRCLLLMFIGLICSWSLPAQQRATVNALVRNERGDSVPFARIRTTVNGANLSVSADTRGIAVLTLPYGRARFVVSTLGYEALERDIEINRPAINAKFVLRTLAQELNRVNVRAAWTGIRGGIGDESTREPIAGAVITLSRGKTRVVTDSSGRFEIAVPEPGGAVVQVAKEGYESKPVRIEVLGDRPSDVVLFLKPGADPRHMKVALDDLARRMAATQLFKFTADYEQLTKVKAKSLYDAIVTSGLLQKNHLIMGDTICLFVNGMARPGVPVNSINVDDVNFIEVYGRKAEVTSSLMTEWPRRVACTSHRTFFPIAGDGKGSRYVGFVSVWTRQ